MFKKELIKENLYRIIDPYGVCMYLIVGEEKAALIDTGYGTPGLKDFIKTITDKEIIVILSHGHIDHIGGIYEFDEVYLNFRDIYTFMKHSNKNYQKYFFEIEHFDSSFPIIETRNVVLQNIMDKQIFSLGDINIQAVNVKGHTQGSMIFFIRELKTMIFNDAIGPGTLLVEDESSNVFEYYQELLKIKEYDGKYDLILRNHGDYYSNIDLLDEVIKTCKAVLDSKDAKQIASDYVYKIFKLDKDLKIYSANKLINNKRVDGKFGNITYREDKIYPLSFS